MNYVTIHAGMCPSDSCLTAYTIHLSDPAVSTAGNDSTRAPLVQNGGKYVEIVHLLI